MGYPKPKNGEKLGRDLGDFFLLKICGSGGVMGYPNQKMGRNWGGIWVIFFC